MKDRTNPALPVQAPSRRLVITGIAMACGALVRGTGAFAKSPQETMKSVPPAAGNDKRTSLHQEVELKAGSERIYDTLLDSKQFTAFSGAPADIDPKPGGTFSMFAGQIVGRNVEEIPHQRLVQAWRPTHWDPGIYSIVKFELKPQGSSTLVVLDHTGFPEGDFDHLTSGWNTHYWDPLRKFLA